MFRAKGSTKPVVGSSPRLASDNAEGSSPLSEIREISAELGDPSRADSDQSRWIRWPVTLFKALIYQPIRIIITQPATVVFLLSLFLFVGVPWLITSGLLSAWLGLRSNPHYHGSRGEEAAMREAFETMGSIERHLR
ncbi:hypothetical protein FALBO_3530 [Fusarium albosuccineum]|uniref:Uncharacterized protein n=1 Tax=Fusarium albosuccineum TaxID=1237068 RepID=A0A8H4LK12_9HYPO|nr:hypothetical protein FALBO_3530 [Fusarium albosuccineum]